MKRVLVLGAQVPFVKGGAELLNHSLVEQINTLEGVHAQLVQLPFKWYPEEQILNDIVSWRLLDLSSANAQKVDLVIGTKFPSYAAQHPNKVLWLVHQHRVLYDLENSSFDVHNADTKVRKKLRSIDTKLLSECKERYTISNNVTKRLLNFNNLESIPLLPPSPYHDKITPKTYKDYVVYIGRVDPLKRVELLINALKLSKTLKAYIIGKGNEDYIRDLKMLIEKNSLQNRCFLLGFLEDEEMLSYLQNSKAVFYAPIDEDYGYLTIESFLAKKPVITCKDSGEVTTNVKTTSSGFICEPTQESIAEVLNQLERMNEKDLEQMAQAGFDFAKSISWKNILNELVLKHI